VAGKWAFRT